jgi:prepilin-type processing-associated H-X9-DG protein
MFEMTNGDVPSGERQRSRAFTLIELLVILVVASLTIVLLPGLVRSRQKPIQTNCVANLKQLGHALQMYIDDNEDSLPGPLWTGMQASCDANSSEQFLYYVAPYLGVPPLKDEVTVIPAAVCPGYMSCAPAIRSIRDMEGRICYLLNPDADPLPGPPVRPFGYPNPQQPPLKRSQLTQYGPLAELFAISDVDKGNLTDPSVSWWSDLPNKPVHSGTRNHVFFDGHVTAVEAAAKTARK